VGVAIIVGSGCITGDEVAAHGVATIVPPSERSVGDGVESDGTDATGKESVDAGVDVVRGHGDMGISTGLLAVDTGRKAGGGCEVVVGGYTGGKVGGGCEVGVGGYIGGVGGYIGGVGGYTGGKVGGGVGVSVGG